MNDLIAALMIIAKYEDKQFPIYCEHDCMHIAVSDDIVISHNDIQQLEEYGFHKEEYGFYSFRYGSC